MNKINSISRVRNPSAEPHLGRPRHTAGSCGGKTSGAGSCAELAVNENGELASPPRGFEIIITYDSNFENECFGERDLCEESRTPKRHRNVGPIRAKGRSAWSVEHPTGCDVRSCAG